MGLPGSEDSLTIRWVVSTQYQRVTDGQTDNAQPIAKTCFSMADASKNLKISSSKIETDHGTFWDSIKNCSRSTEKSAVWNFVLYNGAIILAAQRKKMTIVCTTINHRGNIGKIPNFQGLGATSLNRSRWNIIGSSGAVPPKFHLRGEKRKVVTVGDKH